MQYGSYNLISNKMLYSGRNRKQFNRTSFLQGKNWETSCKSINEIFLLVAEKQSKEPQRNNTNTHEIIINTFQENGVITEIFKHFPSELSQIIHNNQKGVSSKQREDIIELFSGIWSAYCTAHQIDHNFLSVRKLNQDSPLQHACKHFFMNKLLKNQSVPDDIGKVMLGVRTDFIKRLKNELFELKDEVKHQQKEREERSAAIKVFYQAINHILILVQEKAQIQDGYPQNYDSAALSIAQQIHSILKIAHDLGDRNITNDTLHTFGSYIIEYCETQDIKGLDVFADTMKHYFKDIPPEPDVRLGFIVGKMKIIHKDNFAHTDTIIESQENEELKFKDYISLSYKTYGTQKKKYLQNLKIEYMKNMHFFDSTGRLIFDCDFWNQQEREGIRGPYYILNEHTGFWDTDGAVIKKENNPYISKYTLDPNYVRYYAKYKIQNGRLINNGNLFSHYFGPLDVYD